MRKLKKILLVLVLLIACIATGIFAFMTISPQFGQSPESNDLMRISKSPHYQDGVFQNLVSTNMDMSFAEGIKVMKDFITSDNQRVPQDTLPTKFHFTDLSSNSEEMKITWFGHSAVLLELESQRILIDPMLGNYSSPVPFMTKRFPYDQPIPIEDIGFIDAVIISHDHYDHLDYETIVKIEDNVAHFYTALGVGSHLKRWGVAQEKITELDWWESAELDSITLVATPARHFSGRGISDRNKTQWASWVVQGRTQKAYFSGDGGYAGHFSEIGEKYGPFDIAMIECGQYNERWAQIHMMPEESVQAAQDLNAKLMMPIHWGSFNLSLHSWTDPVERVSKAAKKNSMPLVQPYIGERFSLGAVPKEIWWLGKK